MQHDDRIGVFENEGAEQKETTPGSRGAAPAMVGVVDSIITRNGQVWVSRSRLRAIGWRTKYLGLIEPPDFEGIHPKGHAVKYYSLRRAIAILKAHTWDDEGPRWKRKYKEILTQKLGALLAAQGPQPVGRDIGICPYDTTLREGEKVPLGWVVR